MKQKLTILAAIFGLLILSNCQTEEIVTENSVQHSKSNSRRIKFEEFASKTGAMEKFSGIANRHKLSNHKLVYNEAYDFTVDTSEILMIEKGDYDSYTFAVYRNDKTPYVENLVLSKTKEGTYSASLVKYGFTEEELDNHQQTHGIKAKVKTLTLDNEKFDPSSLYRTMQNCVTWSWDSCDWGGTQHFAGPKCKVNGSIDITICYNTEQEYNDDSWVAPQAPGTNDEGGGAPDHPDLNEENPIITEPVLNSAPMFFIRGLNAEQKAWWNNPENALAVRIITNYLNENSVNGVIDSEARDFANWAVEYLRTHPNVTIEQFKNWFMTPREGKDGTYDSDFWENPYLNFPQQNLPSFNDFNNAYPRQAGEDLVQVVGGPVQQAYSQYPQLSRGYCALKVSRALNYSGITIPQIITTNGNPGTLLGGDGKYYFLNAKALNKWMRETFGTFPDNPSHYNFTADDGGTNGENFPTLVAGLKGIYSMVSTNPQWASGHADLIENQTCVFGCHFNDTPPAPIDYIDIWILE